MAKKNDERTELILRVLLLKEIPPAGRGRSLPQLEVMDSFEVNVDSQNEGVEMVNELGGFLEEEFKKDLFECD